MSKGKNTPVAKVKVDRALSPSKAEQLLETLKARFEQNMNRHKGVKWTDIEAKLKSNTDKLSSLNAMETTGGEPDVVGLNEEADEYIFCDCSKETPEGRRNICYDREGQDERERKDVFPSGNAVELAAKMGVELLDERQYLELQKLGDFDMKTSSWIGTPSGIRELGGAIFGDRRYGSVFVYHNGAQSFYSSRGFRGLLRV